MQILSLILVFISAFLAGYFVSSFLYKNKNAELEKQNIKTEAELKVQIAHLEEQLNSVNKQVKSEENYTDLIKKEFINLANQAILEKNKTIDDMNKKTLEAEINPLKEKLGEFQSKIEEFNLTGVKNTQSLKEQIELLLGQSRTVSLQTEKLANALSLNSKFRGNFGEMILEKLLRLSGLVDKNENPTQGNYLLQEGFRDLDTPGANKIKPDAVIFLAEENKNIVIDSKASIVSFLEFANAENEDIARVSIKKFYEDTMLRVKELENKYSNLEGLNVPDFTLLFIPFEACMSYVYANQELIEEANRRNIVIVGPSTLLATLRMVNYAWSNKMRNDNIKEILKTGEGIYAKCQTFIGKLEALSANFDTLRKGFDNTFKSLTGRGGLFGQIAKFKDLGFNPSNPIDEKYLAENILSDNEEHAVLGGVE